MTTTRTPRHLTTLNPAASTHVLRGRARRREVWSAESADGRWRYERDEFPGTPWFVLDTTTGQPAPHPFRTLTAGRAWTWQQEDAEATAAVIAQHGR